MFYKQVCNTIPANDTAKGKNMQRIDIPEALIAYYIENGVARCGVRHVVFYRYADHIAMLRKICIKKRDSFLAAGSGRENCIWNQA